jgi:two-component system, OmpR family, KDP operon response regulator KdpE
MPRTGSTILVVDDELAIRRVLRVCLDSCGYFVHEAISGREALRDVLEIQPDLIILDLGLPDMDGGNVVSKVRESNQCPILILSVRGQESEKAAVLDMGADDYLTKPFGTRELLARVRALLRRSGGAGLVREVKCGRLVIDPGRRRALLEGEEVRLSRTEYGLLKCLIQRQGNIATHRQLVREVWGGLYNESALHLLHVTVSNLRRKIERDPLRPEAILTEPGVGYRLEARP